jgi:D-amino-acid dehydrogenase
VPTSFAERRFVATPMAGGLRLAGRVELGGLTRPADMRLAHGLLPHGRALLPGLEGKKATPWMGHRPTLPDSLPVIGPVPGHAGIFCAFGHHHLGLTQAAVTGRMVAEMLAGRRPGIDPAPYSISRFRPSGIIRR